MRLDKSTDTLIHTEDKYYIIEEYQSNWDRWVATNHYYLPEYENGEFSACGKCWQETHVHGCYDLEYTKTYCNKLIQALKDGLLQRRVDEVGLSAFRICECEKVFKKKPLVADMY